MGGSEPALVPEWLKSNNGASILNHHSSATPPPSSRADDQTNLVSKYNGNGLFKNEKHGGSFSRGNGRRGVDRDWDGTQDWELECIDFQKKQRWFMGDRRDRYSIARGIPGKGDNRILSRSRSMVSEGKGELWSRRMDRRVCNANGGATARKAAVDGNSVSLEKPAVIGDDGWTSALAEVPVVAESNNMTTLVSSPKYGLNMAEALSLPPRPHSSPQIPVGNQRLEELAIKQSRQLIPLTSLVPKTSVHKSDKTKLKPATRSEMHLASKSGHHQLSSPYVVNHALHGIHVKSDTGKSSHVGKLLVLKPAQEKNGISSGPTNSAKVANTAPVVASPSVITSVRMASNPKYIGTEPKASSHLALYAPTMEKRPTVSQVQSRNDFFQLMRKKSATNLSSAPADPNNTLSTVLEGSEDSSVKVSTHISQPNDSLSNPSHCRNSTENGDKSPGDSFMESCIYPDNSRKSSIPVEVFHPNEEERAFLLSLGWEENAGEEEGLTEEEISAFYKKHMQQKSSMKICCRFEHPNTRQQVTSHLDKL